MPDAALPTPRRNGGRFRRAFRDALNRPLTGRVTMMPINTGGAFIAVPVSIELVGGQAEADLPAGDYMLSGILRSADRAAVVINDTVTI